MNSVSRKASASTPSARTASRPGALRRFLKTPKGLVLATLLGLMVLALVNPNEHHGLVNIGFAVATGLVIDGAIALFRKPLRLFSDGGVITGLIVGLILSATAPWYAAVITTAIALVSKHVLKMGRKPLFNPAAVGLLLATFLFSSGQSWWGSMALLPWWSIIFLIVAGFMVAQRVNKFPQVFAFLATYFALLIAMALLHVGLPSDTPGDALRTPFVNSALFLAFFMLTDPPTSPSKYSHQVAFGAITAFIGVVIFAISGGLIYLYIGLLIANLWKAVAIQSGSKSPSKAAAKRSGAAHARPTRNGTGQRGSRGVPPSRSRWEFDD